MLAITVWLAGSEVARVNSATVRQQLLWGGIVLWLTGCGGRPTIPVEEYSSIKRPPPKEVYHRAPPVVVPKPRPVVAEAVAVSRPQPEPVTYQAVELEPVWQEIPPPGESAAPAPRPVEPIARVAPAPAPQPVEDDPLQGMLQKIEQAMQQGAYPRAEGLLERALRIDSQRAGLWHDLAQVRYHQHEYKEAVTLARRSNSFANRGSVLKGENWSLIARSKEALGDLDGARAAWRKAGR